MQNQGNAPIKNLEELMKPLNSSIERTKGGIETRNCKLCGKEFYQYRSQAQTYCSKECFKKSASIMTKNRMKNPEYRKNMTAFFILNKDRFSRLGLKHTPETKLKISLASRGIVNVGEKNGNWQGGITRLNKKIRGLPEYLWWRRKVFLRDNYTCCECHKRGGKLHAHHIESFKAIVIRKNIKTINDARKCADLWDKNNGITLCVSCHELKHPEVSLFKRKVI